ncbi:D-lactate dehydrogenase [Saprolegnia diclina VS20]|uniref:D-lactate dehydrogenase n=1 Tax=Saprolegnia diclina (strain VS20) TaxID=1156394 RepID=T0R071_SAPDV|nr:D-lactate dehydrogenase [Saprolegnia diclina VS20]EQC39720.1 D-lactate dehydrogenase [Saprolegnia diclina VS20]|eukprot:XP_008606992.1 D-lactate dehydrogenase [Saprolegnia diclina VS20]
MINLDVAAELGMTVLRVPAYSPYAVAEHAAGLMMTLNRKYHRAYNRTREFNFKLQGLLGFDLHGKTVGVVGTGKIGALFGKIATGFGCKVIAYDVYENAEALSYGIEYVSLDELFERSDIISLHCPLFPSTHHVINEESIAKMKTGVMLINTSRGGLIDTKALIRGLKNDKIGSVALDVFEGENGIFYEDHSGEIMADENFTKLFTFHNVLVTGHQAFFTKEALSNIAKTTMDNIKALETDGPFVNEVKKQ